MSRDRAHELDAPDLYRRHDPAGMGAAAVDALVTVINGGTVARVIDVPITIVTSENVDDFRAIFQ